MRRVSSLLICLLLTAPASGAVRIGGPQTPPPETNAPAPPAEPPTAPTLKNEVGLAFEMFPGKVTPLGSKLSFRVSAQKKGYVILVDVDSSGRVTQIFPNFLSLATSPQSSAKPNQIAARTQVTIPPANSKEYEFAASPPVGVGMVMAIFSEAPLEVVDLPDVPAALVGQAGAASFVSDAASALRIIPTAAGEEFREPKLSFEARFYVIQ